MAQKSGTQSPENKGPEGNGRDEKGRLLKGRSGNPGGRPKVYAEAKAYAGNQALRMLELLTALADDKETEPGLRRTCAMDVLAYAIGKPTQAVELSGPAGGPIQTVDLTALSAEELLQLRDIAERARADRDGASEPGATTEGDPTPTE